jgi:hypothetical protein
MNEPNQQPQPVRRFDLRHLIAIYTRPRRTFTDLASDARAKWLTPMLVLTLSTILVVLVSGVMNTRAAAMGEIELPPDWQYWSQDMQDNYMQAQQSRQGPLFMYILPMLGSLTGLWLGWFVFSGLLHLASTILGGRGSLRGTLTVVAWASMPYLIRDVLRIVYMLAVSSAISAPGFSGFAGGSGFLSGMLAGIDVFLVWYILLLAIGVAISEGLPRGKAFAGVFVLVLAVLLVQAGIGALGSNLGLSVLSRPYL